MPRNINVKPTAAQANAKAKATTPKLPAKLATTKPKANKPQAAKPVNDSPRGLTRDAATVAALRTNFDLYSDRDSAYLHFFASVCKRNNGTATLAQIHDAGTKRDGNARKRYNPHYDGSAKATDAGAIVRQIKSEHFTVSENGSRLTVTPKAKASAIYAKA